MEPIPNWPRTSPDPNFETTLTPYELSVPIQVNDFGFTSDMAREHLKKNEYTEDMWDKILAGRGESHEIRACIIIARGNEKRLLDIVRANLRLQDYDSYVRYVE